MAVTDPHKCYTEFPLGNKWMVVVVVVVLVMVLVITVKRSHGRRGGDFSDAQKILTTGHQYRAHREICMWQLTILSHTLYNKKKS
jgi:hypothetical protein